KLGSFIQDNGVIFKVYAPNAKSVSVVGDFNSYDKSKNRLKKNKIGIWSGRVANAKKGNSYKYFIQAKDDREFLKADPFAKYAEVKPNSASIIFDSSYEFKYDNPKKQENISIYEVHLGSWKRNNGEYMSYKDLTRHLVKYVKRMGFTHIELLPITEHPFDGSWGYQDTGYFSPTSRYGSPDEFKYFIDVCHKNGIGVILDWVPSHFATDGHGLIAFDGEALYEHPNPQKGYHPQWKSNIFNYDSDFVKSFLISSALWWIEEYKIDGIRVDGVASMLYLDYAREEGEWKPNEYGNNLNLGAIDFLKKLNHNVHKKNKNVIMIAEESTTFLGVTDKKEGLGFDYKWNMGWMNDTIDYFKLDPINRPESQNNLNFMFSYAFDENFVLPLSHDEVVHMKGSMINKMSGLYDWQFANLRSLYSFMYAFMGKKLLFMGNEIAQFNEWHYESQLDWEVLEYPKHQGVQKMIKDLNSIYAKEKALQYDNRDNFEWCNADDASRSIIVFERVYKNERIAIICNFSGASYENYYVPVSIAGKYRLIFNSDSSKYNGTDSNRKRVFKSTPFNIGRKEHMIEVNLTPLSVRFFKLQ
ncbi:MAG TPA: 1,4-alpha-glucan branching protein GlgB, partial [Campylobacterales bacterium]|nr:1,4-alpha-glucan branching protein GlgB [Campylobacterales bacterium]